MLLLARVKKRRTVAAQRWRDAVALSRAGVSRSEAAARLGMTDDGLKSLLHRQTKSSKWPIKND
jgi:hypothetical protein